MVCLQRSAVMQSTILLRQSKAIYMLLSKTKSIPGPKGRPVIGMIPEMMGDMLGMFMDITREHGGIAQFKLCGKT